MAEVVCSGLNTLGILIRDTSERYYFGSMTQNSETELLMNIASVYCL